MKPKKAIFFFSDVVVVRGDLIGVVVKSWWSIKDGYKHEVYVRSLNLIEEYKEAEMEHFVYSKELSDEEKEFYA